MYRHAEDNEDTDKTFPRGGTTCDAYNVSEINNTGMLFIVTYICHGELRPARKGRGV